MTTESPKLSPSEAAQTLSQVLARAKAAEAGAILIVEFPGEVVREIAAEELQKKLSEAGDELVEVDLRQQQDLFEVLRGFKANQVASIHGLHAQPDLVRRLNWRREFFGQQRVRVVFWLNPDETQDLARRSPDFWAFYNRFLRLEAIARELDIPVIHRPSVLEVGNLESQRELDRIAALEELLEGITDPKSKRAIGIRNDLSIVLLQTGQSAKAIPVLLEALEVSRQIGDKQGEGSDLGNLGIAYRSLGNYPKAIEHYRQALEIARQIGDKKREGIYLGNLGIAYRSLSDYPKAIEHHRQALEISRQIGDKQIESNALGSLGLGYFSLGNYPKAIEHYQQALEIARQIGDKQGEGIRLGNLAYAHLQLGNYSKAIPLSEQALAIARQIGDKSGQGHYLDNIGDAFLQLGNYEKAAEYLSKSWLILSEIGSPNANIALDNLHKVRFKWPQFESYLREHFPTQAPEILEALAQAQP